jgi:hypothetical protein
VQYVFTETFGDPEKKEGGDRAESLKDFPALSGFLYDLNDILHDLSDGYMGDSLSILKLRI